MLTVLDPSALVTGEANSWPEVLPNIIALSGDEQLALAATERLDTITISAADIESPSEADEENLRRVALGIARYGGQEIIVLSVAHLFAAALRRKERRRRRF